MYLGVEVDVLVPEGSLTEGDTVTVTVVVASNVSLTGSFEVNITFTTG